MDNILFFVAIIFYFIATSLYMIYIFIPSDGVKRGATFTLSCAFVIHGVSFTVRGLIVGHFPVTSLFESLSFYSWLLAGGYLLLEIKYNLPVLGAFVSPLNLIMALFAFFVRQPAGPLPPALRSGWLTIHAVTSFIGEAAFALSFAVSVVYLLQERQIKKKRMGILFRRLPPLNKLDDINYKILTIGFPFLTLGIITGAVWANYAWGSYWSWDPKETWSLITWLVYAGILHGRLTVGWRGRRAAIFSIIGFACVLFTFLGVNLLLPGLHSYSRM